MGYSVMCGSGVYSAEVGCSIGEWVDDALVQAQQSEAALDQALIDLAAAFDENTTTPTYAPDLSGIGYAFTAPTISPQRGNYSGLAPAEVVLPARAGLLSEAESDAIFERGRARITRAFQANVRAALEQPASLGLGMASPAILRRMAEANQKKAEGTAQVALEQAAQEGVWAREDIKTILTMELTNFKEKWTVIKERLTAEEDTLRSEITQYTSELQKEAERRGWTELEIKTLLEEASTSANVAIQWGRITLDKLMQTEEIIVKMKAAVFQAWLQYINLSMTFNASQGVSVSEQN